MKGIKIPLLILLVITIVITYYFLKNFTGAQTYKFVNSSSLQLEIKPFQQVWEEFTLKPGDIKTIVIPEKSIAYINEKSDLVIMEDVNGYIQFLDKEKQ